MKELQKALEKTRKYGQKFGGWTEEQVRNRLITSKKLQISKSKAQIKDKNYKEKMEIAKNFTEKYLKKIGDILMVGVTGSVAAENPGVEDDIDLMIITKSNCLWTTRLRIFMIFWRDRIPHRTKKNNICINLWLDEEALEVPKNKQYLRNAMDLILMKPILNRDQTYEKFILANSWVKRYVRNAYERKILNSKLKTLNIKIKNNYLNMLVNWIFFMGQYWYMRKKMKKEVVGLHRAFFHPGN